MEKEKAGPKGQTKVKGEINLQQEENQQKLR